MNFYFPKSHTVAQLKSIIQYLYQEYVTALLECLTLSSLRLRLYFLF